MRLLFILSSLLFCQNYASAQWTEINTEIDDDLKGITTFDNRALIAGQNGLYYNLDLINSPNDWTEFTITGNPTDAAFYENIEFTHCSADPLDGSSGNIILACGHNTVTDQAVLFKLSLPDLSHEIVYIGETGSRLNQIAYNNSYNYFAAVGDNGLIVRFKEEIVTVIDVNTTADLSSVDFSSFRARFGADELVLTGSLYDDNNSINLNIIETPGVNHHAVSYDNSFSHYSAGTDYTEYTNSGGLEYNNNFAYGELNARTIFLKVNIHLVGTDHGIFKSGSGKSYLEWQPSSQNHAINAIWEDFFNNKPIFACGDNGVLLKTENLGGATIPYVALSAYGRCVGSNAEITRHRGSSNSCIWTIDGEQVSTSCNTYTSTFSQAGTYEISLTGTNSFGESATATQTITVVPVPDINLPVTVLDTLICKKESIEITLDETQADIRYSLRAFGFNPSFYGTSEVADGSPLTFTTDSISEGGAYRLYSSHSLANCGAYFQGDTIHLEVEKTEAKYVSQFINAEPNEAVRISEIAVDAQNFAWEFSPAATPNTDIIPTPTTAFANLGETEVDLIAWSDANCYDSIQSSGPFIYDVPNDAPECFTLVHSGEDIYNGQLNFGEYPGHSYPQMTDMTQTEEGFLTTGNYVDQIFDSRWGTSKDMIGKAGSFLSSHRSDGTLRWMVYTIKNALSDRDMMFGSVIDHDGNIYISGTSRGKFYDNFGNIIDLSLNPTTGFILKLNPNGELIWDMQCNSFFPKRLSIDEDNNLIFAGDISGSSSTVHALYLNNIKTDTLKKDLSILDINYVIAKFTPEGTRIWDTGINLDAVNGKFIEEVHSDKDNNLYIGGNYESQADFYSVGNDIPDILPGYPASYGQKMFLAKYNENGQYVWSTRSTVSGVSNASTKLLDMATDSLGNTYISGRSDCISSGSSHIFENTDGSTTQESVGGLYILKVDSTGICQWIKGAAHSYYGFGEQVNLSEDEVHLVGYLSDNNSNPQQVDFLSENGAHLNLTILEGNYFIAVYDFAGNIKRVILSGAEEQDYFYVTNYVGFFKGEDDAYYIARALGFFNGITDYEGFGHIIPGSNGVDATVSRVTESCGLVYYANGDVDADGDGFTIEEDCDDTNSAVNPDATEIANNDIDENCDGIIEVIDIDGDGFNSDEDCDDMNPDINPNAVEIYDNDIDENCDGIAEQTIDMDGDGFNANEDCDDMNPDINPDADEIANNDIDENCDGLVEIIDNDNDGFNSDEDCDDNNADINPVAEEIYNNEIDEDCDGIANIIDEDNDGFNSDEDCDDFNADINPDAIEIPNNEIDEDCDGADLINSIQVLGGARVNIFPNPVKDFVIIEISSNIAYQVELLDLTGKALLTGENLSAINLSAYPAAVYFLEITDLETKTKIIEKLIVTK